MSSYLLDTSALLALRHDEPGADRVAELLTNSANTGKTGPPGKGGQEVFMLFGCFMSLMEVMYRVWKVEGEAAGREAYANCQALPITWVHESAELLESAAKLKALHPLSLADAWIAASAMHCGAILVHKDPEFEPIEGLLAEQLPYK